MNINKQALALASIVVGSYCQMSEAAPITIDGNLSDWGITVGDNNSSNFGSLAGDVGLVSYHLEDTGDTLGHSYYLGLNYGGQDYDAEFMGVAVQGTTLYVTLVTGQRQDNGFSFFSPGDFRFETSGGTFGVEAGGKAGGSSGVAITEGAVGSTYNLYSNGVTQSYSNAAAAQTAGSIWHDETWILDPISPKGPVQLQIDGQSQYVGMADYIYTGNTVTTQHSIIEFAIDLSVFEGEDIYSLHWRPSCGNDEMNVTLNISTKVPEPGTLALLMVGLLGFSPVIRRKVDRSTH